ncbi:MAG: type IV pilin N-terminal domain-containing protein [Methanosarcinales archaeon]|nr:type IV pilin N-terminal domain-containing protein [Methanosarcinales archaeon]
MRLLVFYNNSAVSPVIGVILLIAITVASSGAAFVLLNSYELEKPVITLIDIENIDLSNHQEVILVHKGGDPIDITQINILISINDEMLDHNLINLPVIGGITGFYGALGGVFWGSPSNQSHDNIWGPGEYGNFKIASSNAVLKTGDQIKVTIVHNPTNIIISSPTYII